MCQAVLQPSKELLAVGSELLGGKEEGEEVLTSVATPQSNQTVLLSNTDGSPEAARLGHHVSCLCGLHIL